MSEPKKGSLYEHWHPGELELLPAMIRRVREMMNPKVDAGEEIDLHVPVESVAEVRRVIEERIRQNEIWGVQRVSLAEWGLILGEEYGEAIADATKHHFEGEDASSAQQVANLKYLRTELSQVAAVAIAWMEHVTEMIEEAQE